VSSGRKLVWLGLAALAVVVLVVALWPSDGTPTVRARTRSLASELRCVDCEGLSVAESSTASARQTRRDIEARIRRGQSDEDIRQVYVDRFGESILLKPSSSGIGVIVWALPVIVLIVGAGGLALALRRWGRQPRLVATDADEALVAQARAREGSEPGA
jgi:cytochrome c-type biogenesis protein CcmH/NrfF